MAYTNRGGPPFARLLTITTTGIWALSGVANSAQVAGTPYGLAAPTSWIRLTATSFPARIYFSQAAYDADVDYLTVGTTLPVEMPAEVSKLWARGVGGTATVELLAVSKV